MPLLPLPDWPLSGMGGVLTTPSSTRPSSPSHTPYNWNGSNITWHHIRLTACLSLRYLSEERLEVQVWASTSANQVRPAARDVLIGSVYVLLSDLIAEGGSLR